MSILILFIAGVAIGGIIGAGIGYIAPSIGGFLGSSFAMGGVATAGSGAIAMSVTGAQILAGTLTAALGLGILFSRIGISGGYRIDHHYPNDHDPIHVHISGDDGKTRVDLDGNPIQGDRPMTVGERKAFKRLLQKILKKLSKWL